ncbi:MAG TPA: ATP-binding protein [Spirochaetota bacterium]|nr:ATP-binding protein [Spirochaetota bacterium]
MFLNGKLLKSEVHLDKKVAIEYTLTPRKVVYVIRDDGAGFDHKKMRDSALATANDELLSHGRGIAMTTNAFDEVTYNNKGNEVKLVKYFRD